MTEKTTLTERGIIRRGDDDFKVKDMTISKPSNISNKEEIQEANIPNKPFYQPRPIVQSSGLGRKDYYLIFGFMAIILLMICANMFWSNYNTSQEKNKPVVNVNPSIQQPAINLTSNNQPIINNNATIPTTINVNLTLNMPDVLNVKTINISNSTNSS